VQSRHIKHESVSGAELWLHDSPACSSEAHTGRYFTFSFVRAISSLSLTLYRLRPLWDHHSANCLY